MQDITPVTSFRGYYGFLSNFHPCQMSYRGLVYPSSEHAFQAAKTENRQLQMQIAELATAGDAKRMGQAMAIDMARWERIKLATMLEIVRVKFDRNAKPALSSLLRETWPRLLIEGNTWHDTFWGVCDGVGENWLGRILMLVRSELFLKPNPF